MTLKKTSTNRSARYWCAYVLLVLLSGFLALGSAYMAYQVTQENSVTVGFAGIGFYVLFYLGSSSFLQKIK